MGLVLTVNKLPADEKHFWESGKQAAMLLKKYVNENSVVLDVGCGIGRIMKFLAPYVGELHGVDVSLEMIELAKKELSDIPNVFLHLTNGVDLKIFPENTFDFVYSFITLQHLEKEDAYVYMEEIYRVLKPGGKAFLGFPNLFSKAYWNDFLHHCSSIKSRLPSRVRVYTPNEVCFKLRKAGFKTRLFPPKDNIHVLCEKRGV